MAGPLEDLTNVQAFFVEKVALFWVSLVIGSKSAEKTIEAPASV
jgi:hypothetical protein